MPITEENGKFFCDDQDILTVLHLMKHPRYLDDVMRTGLCHQFKSNLIKLFNHNSYDSIDRDRLFNERLGSLNDSLESIFSSWRYVEFNEHGELGSYVIPFDFDNFIHDLNQAHSSGILDENKVIRELIECEILKISEHDSKLSIFGHHFYSDREAGFDIFSNCDAELYKHHDRFAYLKLRFDLLNHFEREMKKALR
jgi:hypothetical protein